MAILDVTLLNQYQADSLRQRGGEPLQNLLSGGTMSNDTMVEILRFMRVVLNQTGGTGPIPDGAYGVIAELMMPSSQGFTQNSLQSILKSTDAFGLLGAGASIDEILNNSLQGAINQYNGTILEIQSKISNAIYNAGGKGALSGITQQISGAISNEIKDALSTIFPQVKLSNGTATEVAKILSGETPFDQLSPPQQVQDALDTVKKSLPADVLATLSPQDEQALGGLLSNLQGTIAGTVENIEDLPKPPPYEIGSGNFEAGGSFVSSMEELEAEMASTERPISEMIIHWSETFTNANLSAQQLQDLTGAGIDNYHFIIKRDGSIERGVSLDEVGNHTPVLNHNAFSIGVCLVGGVNVASGTEDIEEVTTASSITRGQFNTLYEMFRIFFNQYPGGQALGHMDVDITQEDPGFDVRDYVYNNFNKLSLYVDPLTEPAKSPDDIIAALDAEGLTVLEKDPDVLEKKF